MTKYDFVSEENLFRLAKIKKGDLWGLLNVDSNQEVVPPRWSREPKFTRDVIIFYDNERNGYGVINHEGKVIIEPKFYEINPITANRIVVKTSLCLYGLYDGEGNELLPYIYKLIGYENDNCIVVGDPLKKLGIIDLQGNVKLPFEYDCFRPYSWNKVITCQKDGKWGVITQDYKWLLPCEFDDIHYINGYITAKKNGFVTLYDMKGNKILYAYHHYINPVNDDVFIVARNNKKGLILRDGTVVKKCIYDDIQDIGNGCFKVCKESPNSQGKIVIRWGIINSSGQRLTDCKYSDIGEFVGDFVVVRSEEGYGYLNSSGKVIVEPKYELAFYDDGNFYIKVKKDGLWGIFDLEGNQVTPIIYDFIHVTSYKSDTLTVEYRGKEGVVML